MNRKYFGTDGIRGRVGQQPMTVDFAMRLANAAARVMAPDGGSVVIGKDTRVSGYMFESALEAGFVAAGFDVYLLGPLPTPGIAHITHMFNANLGVVISASHNPFFDNGIKFFDSNGAKLSDEIELQIEALAEGPVLTRDSMELGRAKRVDTARTKYQDFLRSTFPTDLDLSGMKIVIDASHGAGYKVGPRCLAELGAEIVPIGCSPNGRNINADCGSTAPELLQTTVTGVGADVGIALDGDGDRVLMVDENGELLDGDQILFLLAAEKQRLGELKGPVVGTVMSNLGLERALADLGIDFVRAKVGDRYVLEMLREAGGILGGETSGHMICLDQTTTGDGLVTALQVLAIAKRSGRPLSELSRGMKRYPQQLINVRAEVGVDPNVHDGIRAARARAETDLGDRGRVVLRASGTEPVIRVMVEGDEAGLVERTATSLANAVKAAVHNPG
ncbi:MAG: phosphoglucosamine mutase [Gammaproteobacteria bacterium]